MSDIKLSKTTTVAERVLDIPSDQAVTFREQDFETGRFTFTSIDAARWKDMGEPDEVTISVQPGNKLEEEVVEGG